MAELELGLSVNGARAGGQAVGFPTLRAIARCATSATVGRSERSVSAIKLAILPALFCSPLVDTPQALSTLLAGLLGFDKVDQAAGGAV